LSGYFRKQSHHFEINHFEINHFEINHFKKIVNKEKIIQKGGKVWIS